MTEYETIIEYIDNEHKYIAHVREVGSSAILYSSSPQENTEDALRETQGYFVLHGISDEPINSSIKNFNQGTFEPKKNCCGR
jgi:hypothetical protein